MKKIYLLILAVTLFNFCYSQGTLLHITPNNAWKGQTLSTTITGQGTQFQTSTIGGGVNSIYLSPVAGGNNIFPSFWNYIDDQHLSANFFVPASATLGVYHLNVDVFIPVFPFQTTLTDTNGFLVTASDGFISGSIYYDLNGNGNKDTGEPPASSRKILETPDNYLIYSDNSGNYTLGVLNGTYNMQYQPTASEIVTSVSSYNNIVINNNTVSANNFGMQYPPTYDSLTVVVAHWLLRCNTNQPFTVSVTNHCGHVMNGRLHFSKDPQMAFVSSVPPPDFISGDSVYWNISGLGILETFTAIPVYTLPGANTLISYNIVGEVFDAGNNVIYTDSRGHREMTQCSFDPNDKQVDPPGVQSQNYTLFSDELTYTIRFQNTGNDTAFRVTIHDTLDADLDLNMFTFVSSSHPVAVNLDPANRALKFTFYDILLPDSNINEPGSHGYVTYRISAQSGLPANTVINNTAHIVFDWNPAVVTNTTFNTMVYTIPVGMNEINAQSSRIIYPNPIDETATIYFENPAHEKFVFIVSDINGRKIRAQETTTNLVVIEKNLLDAGLYFFSLSSETHITNYYGKFVIR